MFEASFILGLRNLVLNILLPLLIGIIFIWIFYGIKFKGLILYLLSRFIGVGVLAFSFINLQFIHFGVGIIEYLMVLGVLIAILVMKTLITKDNFKKYIKTLIIKFDKQIFDSFKSLSGTGKVFSLLMVVFSGYFVLLTFIYNFNLPTYADDSFGNRNLPAVNIYTDGGIKFFGEENEILGRGRLGYPIQIPAYKALIAKFAGGINDIYFNVWQELVFIFGLLFIFVITYNEKKNILVSIIPVTLICGMPLMFFHAFEGYMEFASVIYSVLTIWCFYKYLVEKDMDFTSLGLCFAFMLSYIKNDGFIVYVPGIIFALLFILIIKKELIPTIKEFFKDKANLLKSTLYFCYFFLPFLIIKIIHGLGFNQAAGENSGIGISSSIHTEIFTMFKRIFIEMDNYNIVLVPLLLLIYATIKSRNKNYRFLILSGSFIFLILLLVFLLTENYKFVMDQTTVNRVFTMTFIIIFAFSGLIINHEKIN